MKPTPFPQLLQAFFRDWRVKWIFVQHCAKLSAQRLATRVQFIQADAPQLGFDVSDRV
jgi:hypothetical protein